MTEHPVSTLTLDPAPRIWLRRAEGLVLVLLFFGPPVAAWLEFLAFGLPRTLGNEDPANPVGPHQFPLGLRVWHYLNLLLFALLARSGWMILLEQPGLAWSESGPSWFRFRFGRSAADPIARGSDRGPLRFWHAVLGVAWAVSGMAYVVILAATGEREHLIPLSWKVFPEAWHVFVQYSTFHLPLDPDGYYRYNSLQLISYTTVMLGFVPLIALTGLAISPAVGGPGAGLARLFGNREAARSIHYLAILGYLAFLVVHVFFVVLYAAWLNGNHVVLGTDETGLPGWVIGGAGLGLIGLVAWATRRLVGDRSSAG